MRHFIILMAEVPFETVTPIPFLSDCVGQPVTVRLKWGIEYKGILLSFDKYMNFQMINATEWVNGENRGLLGEILIRCNNVLYVKSDNT